MDSITTSFLRIANPLGLLLLAAPLSGQDEAGSRGAEHRFGPASGGMRAALDMNALRYPVGSSIVPMYVVRNESDSPQTLWSCGFWPNHLIEVRNDRGELAPLTDFGQLCRDAFDPSAPTKKTAPIVLAPGEQDNTQGGYDLAKLFKLTEPGRYTVQITLVEEKPGGWTGRLESPAVTFEVVR